MIEIIQISIVNNTNCKDIFTLKNKIDNKIQPFDIIKTIRK